MPDYRDIENEVISLANYIDGRVEMVQQAAAATQQDIYQLLTEEILKFEISNGRFVANQDFRKRLMLIQRKIEAAMGSKQYAGSIRDFLTDFSNIQDKTIRLHKNSSTLEMDIKELNPIRQHLYDQAKTALVDGNHPNFIEPVKQLLANQVLRGNSISDATRVLEHWNAGDLSSGRLANGVRTPSLTRYATQIARDTSYAVQRNTNNAFTQKFGFTKFIYAGNLVADSRPLCVFLVNLDRPIDLDELPPLIARFPQGLYPGTNKDNFCQVCGGYACRHIAHAVPDDGIDYGASDGPITVNTRPAPVQPETLATDPREWSPGKEVKNLTDFNDVMKSFAYKYPEYFERGFKEVLHETNKNNNGSTDLDGKIWMNKDRLDSIYDALNAIRNGKPTSLKHEDALSTLLHEMVHNQNKLGSMSLKPKERLSMELANEFISRNSLENFMKQLGGELQNKQLVTDRKSTGYNTMVKNYQNIIDTLGIDNVKVIDTVRKHLFDSPYYTQLDGLIAGIQKNYTGSMKLKFTEMITKARDNSAQKFQLYLDSLGQ